VSVAENVRKVMENIKTAAESCGRKPEDIILVAATKTQSSDTVREAIAAGIKVCGENRVQELVEKRVDGAYEGAALHFIGHLQRNKVKQVVGAADLIESVDSVELLRMISQRAQLLGICQEILLEVNIGGEESKSGVAPQQLEELLLCASSLEGIKVRGLMTIPPAELFPGENIPYFKQMYQLFVDIRDKKYDNVSMDFLSMGMSRDYAEAIECGANMVRVGTAIFGQRKYI